MAYKIMESQSQNHNQNVYMALYAKQREPSCLTLNGLTGKKVLSICPYRRANEKRQYLMGNFQLKCRIGSLDMEISSTNTIFAM